MERGKGEYKDYFNIQILVDPRLSLEEQLKLRGIESHISLGSVINLTEIPEEPYKVFARILRADATHPSGYSVEEALQEFAKDEVGSPLIEVVALWLLYPELFLNLGVLAPGSIYDEQFVPSVDIFSGKPEIHAYRIDFKNRNWGVLSRRKRI